MKKKEPKIKICKFCGEYFETTDGRRKHCSKACYEMSKLQNAHLQYKENREKIIGSPTRICGMCGKEFEVSRKNRKYCSDKCRVEAVHKQARDRYRNIVLGK